jgi:hypothetical protein
VSIGQRDQRVRLYTATDGSADGWADPRFVFSAERWARVEPMRSDDPLLASQTEHTQGVVVAFAGEVSPARGGALKAPDGRVYLIQTVDAVRSAREVKVKALWQDEATPTLYAADGTTPE